MATTAQQIADLFVQPEAVEDRTKHLHQITIAEDTIGRDVKSCFFSINDSGMVFEYPDQFLSSEIRWQSPSNCFHQESVALQRPNASRWHSTREAFASSIFNRISVPWNDLIDCSPNEDGDESARTRTLSMANTTVFFKDDGTNSRSITNHYVIITDRRTSFQNEHAVKDHFLKILREI